jgi:hypothetical protein
VQLLQRFVITTLLCLTPATVAACGGHTATKSDVIARGNEICESASSAIRSVPPPTGHSLAQLGQYYEQVTPIVEHEARQLRALPTPAQSQALLRQYQAAVGEAATAYGDLATAARKGDAAGVASASATLRSSPAASLAVRYGLARCGGSLGTAV